MTLQTTTSAVFPNPAYPQGFEFGEIAVVEPDEFQADRSATALTGHRAVRMDGVHVGSVVDVIHDEGCQPRGYVVDAGGFLGLDATPVFLPVARARVRIDGIAVELVIDLYSAEVNEIIAVN